MLLSTLLQRREVWHFDFRSALIGAFLAWILAGIAYSQRQVIASFARSAWEPIAAWRRRVRASQDEKYVKALQQALRRLLLFEPKEPERVFVAPDFLAPAPLPSTVAEVAGSPRTVIVPFDALLAGHQKLVITGGQGSGRTTALVMSVWSVVDPDFVEGQRPYSRVPTYIDLTRLKDMGAQPGMAPVDRIAALVAAGMPGASPKWLAQQLRRDPSLILIDNWERLPADSRIQVAGWIDEASERMPEAIWVVASGAEGYGHLVEKGFVPVELLPPADTSFVADLYEGWQALLDITPPAPPESDEEGDAEIAEAEVLRAFESAARAGGPLWELHLRIRLYLRTGEIPDRPVEVLAAYLDSLVAGVDLGKGAEVLLEPAQETTLQTLVEVGAMHRFEARYPTGQEMYELIESQMPPKEERPRRLDAAVRKLLTDSGMLRQDGKVWRIPHEVWIDYLAAIHLAGSDPEQAMETIQGHMGDPLWATLTEFYAGLADMEGPAKTLINQSEIYGDQRALLRAARWAVVSDPEQPWRTSVTKVIAQAFLNADIDTETRLSVARALGVVAGNGARAFFLRALRTPTQDVQRAALRGLGWIGSPRDMPILAAAMRDPGAGLRETAVSALRDLNTPGATAFLGEVFPTVEEPLMLAIAAALAECQGGAQVLEDATRHPDLMVRRCAALGLGRVDADWAHALLLEIAREDPEWLVRSAADTALQAQEERTQRHTTVTSPPVVDAMDWLMAWAARQGLGLGVGDAAMAMLVRAAEEGNVDAKVLSALTLAQIGREADARVLEPLQAEEDFEVQRAAAWALQRIRQRYSLYQGG